MNPASVQGVTAPQAPLSLLHLIAEDADFRARLESDPVSAFAEHGIEVQGSKCVMPVGFGDDPDLDDLRKVRWLGLLG